MACEQKRKYLFRKVKWAQRIMGKKKESEIRVVLVVVGKHDDMSRHSCERELCESKDTKTRLWHGEKICQEVSKRHNRENYYW